MHRTTAWVVTALLTLGCGDNTTVGDGGAGGQGGAATTSSGGPTTSAGVGGGGSGWTTLIDAGWTVPSGTEAYWCALTTVTEDTYVKAFRAIAPPGTHHTVVVITDTTQPDGVFPCGPSTLSDEMIFASGVGSDELAFPEGVAMRIPAGRKVLLNLHLFNTATSPLDGLSGTEILTMPAADVQQEAEVVFGGTLSISVPPMQVGGATGRCVFGGDSQVIAIWPHMHQYGRHMTVTHESSAGDAVLHDGDYRFEEQLNYRIDPVTVRAGESVRVDCSYENTSDGTLIFGDSSLDEMCFAGLYRYPSLKSGSLFCVQ